MSSTISTRLGGGLDRFRFGSAVFRLLDQRQSYLEARAFADACAMRGYAPTVHLDESLHYRQADAQASLRTVERAIALDEQVEYPGQQFRRNA